MVPLLFGSNTPGLELVRPLSVVVLGGLVTSVLVNVGVVPALYLRVAQAALAPAREPARSAAAAATA
jgi:Cu/Ag efflux pump CusA